MAIRKPKVRINDQIRDIYSELLPNRDERYPEISNLPEDNGLELEHMFNDDSRPVVMKPPYETAATLHFKNEGNIESDIVREALDKLDKNVPVEPKSFDVNGRKAAMLNIIDELIQHYVGQRDYAEVGRLTAFAAGTNISDLWQPPVNQEEKVAESRYNTPVTINTLLREKDPTLLRPRETTEELPPIPNIFEEFERIMKRRDEAAAEARKAAQAAKIKKAKAKAKPKVKAKKKVPATSRKS